ncbi:hypothetical protein BUALT_Bualt14G0020900 [Buddleja alternifolia]|uniref:Uncharacterized protein n=1 Tax=Buddleja alternifolia TaxID=168488 RepID=A0AAV6WFY8_9LAMI|nr:hypothetical protein BUALT_Bualt14G0020900 [Buddleja alternifolia]
MLESLKKPVAARIEGECFGMDVVAGVQLEETVLVDMETWSKLTERDTTLDCKLGTRPVDILFDPDGVHHMFGFRNVKIISENLKPKDKRTILEHIERCLKLIGGNPRDGKECLEVPLPLPKPPPQICTYRLPQFKYETFCLRMELKLMVFMIMTRKLGKFPFCEFGASGSRLSSTRNHVAKDIRFGVEARALMLKDPEELAGVVKETMGLKGRNVVIEQSWGAPNVAKDGVTVTKSIKFKDKVKNIGESLIEQFANATHDIAGDGTTCASILTFAIFTKGCKSVAANMNAMDFRRGFTMVIDVMVTNLKNRGEIISKSEKIAQVGTIWENREREIGELITNAMERVGKEVVTTIQDGKTLFNELEVVEGMKLVRGYISSYFITNQANQKCELDNSLIVNHEKTISSINAIVKVLELALKRQRPLVIVVENVEGDTLATLIHNKLQAGIKVCTVKAPRIGENKKSILQDLVVLIRGKVITQQFPQLNVEDLRLSLCGEEILLGSVNSV